MQLTPQRLAQLARLHTCGRFGSVSTTSEHDCPECRAEDEVIARMDADQECEWR